MTKYENLLTQLEEEGIEILDLNLGTNKECGKCFNNLIVINSRLNKNQKHCVLIEELGHFYKTSGDITDQTKTQNRKQELIARRWGYKRLVGIVDLINAHKQGCRNKYEISDYLCITEGFLEKALEYYKCKYPDGYEIDNYWINFNNGLEIFERFY